MEAMAAKGGPKPVPHYLRPSTGSCHNACKHGGHHAFEERQAPRAQPKPRKKPPPSASDDQNQKRRLVKVRSVSRRRVGDFSKPDKADTPAGGSEIVEWKDIVAYDAVPLPAPAPGPGPADGPSQQSDGKKKRDVMKGKAPLAKTTHQETLVKKPTESLNKRLAKTVRSTLAGKASMRKPQAAADKEEAGKSTQSVKPPKAKKSATSPVENKETVQGDAATDVKQGGSLYTPDQEERAAIAESSRAHRRAKSMSFSSRSVRFPFTRQASKNSASFKLRSKSSKAPILPPEQEKPTRLRFRKGRAAGEESSSSSSGGIQLRARSLRRRGSSATGTGFMVPEVTLRHQKTQEKKKSRRLSNNLIEETASKLAKSRKSRVKSLVGAFETLVSKIGK